MAEQALSTVSHAGLHHHQASPALSFAALYSIVLCAGLGCAAGLSCAAGFHDFILLCLIGKCWWCAVSCC